MQKHIFYQKYANMPLAERTKDQTFLKGGYGSGMSAHDIYKEMSRLDDTIRPFVVRQEELLRLADKIFRVYE